MDGTGQNLGFMGHVVADFPSPQAARDMVSAMIEAGITHLEIQIPFSEPVADGPVLLAANHAALAAGVDFRKCCEFAADVTMRYAVPVYFMTYANVPFRIGWDRFAEQAHKSGVQGVIVPDLPIEESAMLDEALRKRGMHNIRVIAPNASAQRIEQICRKASGMVYAAARSGVTGTQTTLSADLFAFIQKIRAFTKVPVAVGFGISSRKDIEFLRGIADVAVVGSQTFREWERGGVEAVRQFWLGLTRLSQG